ncbi:MAG: hypothetical protein K2X77_18685 [Candidatus Obscuribacterales bacterium]|nr:hypothetical protein [Candidatus Obscuribacterales bacterium]
MAENDNDVIDRSSESRDSSPAGSDSLRSEAANDPQSNSRIEEMQSSRGSLPSEFNNNLSLTDSNGGDTRSSAPQAADGSPNRTPNEGPDRPQPTFKDGHGEEKGQQLTPNEGPDRQKPTLKDGGAESPDKPKDEQESLKDKPNPTPPDSQDASSFSHGPNEQKQELDNRNNDRNTDKRRPVEDGPQGPGTGDPGQYNGDPVPPDEGQEEERYPPSGEQQNDGIAWTPPKDDPRDKEVKPPVDRIPNGEPPNGDQHKDGIAWTPPKDDPRDKEGKPAGNEYDEPSSKDSIWNPPPADRRPTEGQPVGRDAEPSGPSGPVLRPGTPDAPTEGLPVGGDSKPGDSSDSVWRPPSPDAPTEGQPSGGDSKPELTDGDFLWRPQPTKTEPTIGINVGGYPTPRDSNGSTDPSRPPHQPESTEGASKPSEDYEAQKYNHLDTRNKNERVETQRDRANPPDDNHGKQINPRRIPDDVVYFNKPKR